MNLLYLCFLITLFKSVRAYVDCTIEDTCFGEPEGCHPDYTCKTVFQFDHYGNLHVYLRNFNNIDSYVAFPVQTHMEDIIEYFLCVPHQKRRVRGIAELGGMLLLTGQNITGIVEERYRDYFRCSFNNFELPDTFQQSQHFFVSNGKLDDIMVIYDGWQLYNLDYMVDYRLDDEEEARRQHIRRREVVEEVPQIPEQIPEQEEKPVKEISLQELVRQRWEASFDLVDDSYEEEDILTEKLGDESYEDDTSTTENPEGMEKLDEKLDDDNYEEDTTTTEIPRNIEETEQQELKSENSGNFKYSVFVSGVVILFL